MTYRAITWWKDAYHVFYGDKRIGIVNKRVVAMTGQPPRDVWFAHNYNFFGVKGEFPTRTDAANAIPKGKVHQPVDAFS